MKNSKKITFFIGSMANGGAERVISLLANHYAQKGHDVSIALLLKNQVDYEQFKLDQRIHIVDLTLQAGSYLKNSFGWLRKIRKYLKNQRPDVVVSFIGRINALVLTASIGLHIPMLVSERNDPQKDGRGKGMLAFCRHVYRRADKVVFQTDYAKRCFPKLPAEKCAVIPNPVEIERKDGLIRNPNLITTAGRLNHVKNQAMLIDAMRYVHEKNKEARCSIFGRGEEEENLKKLIGELRLDGVVTLEGNKRSIGPYLSESSVFVLPSLYEGMPNALIEAMMAGNACIATDFSGVEEIIEDKVNGLIVKQNDSRALSESILLLLSDCAKREELSNNALLSSEKYRKESVLQLWDKEIESLLLATKVKKR